MILSLPPTILIPCMNCPHLLELSSIIHFTDMVQYVLFTSSLITVLPASPAPMTMTLDAFFLFWALCLILRIKR